MTLFILDSIRNKSVKIVQAVVFRATVEVVYKCEWGEEQEYRQLVTYSVSS